MRPTRRDVLRAASLGGASLALPPSFFPPRRVPARAVDPRGTTLDSTVLRSPAELRAGGYRLLVTGPGEPHVVRDDLGAKPHSGRDRRRKAVSTFLQLTDIHLVDAQSPARVEFFDRYSDDPTQTIPFDAAWRAHETLSLHLCDAIVRGAMSVARGPVTGRPFEFTICTGDNVDNTHLNETRWFVDLMDGGTVTPDSGDLTRYEGVQDQDAATYDVHYWHPDGPPSGKDPDLAHSAYGFPSVPGLLDAARKPFAARGLDTPWYVAFGNHDPLLQGNVPAYEPGPGGTDVPTGFATIATGTLKVVSAPVGISPGDMQDRLITGDAAFLADLLNQPARQVTADPDRRPLARSEFMAEMFKTTGTPVGHGFAQDNVTSGAGYYAFDHGAFLRCVVLDTVNPGGYADGSIDQDQLAWLQGELDANAATRRLVVVFSHHTVATMNNPIPTPGDPRERVLGPDVEALLLGYPHVVLWVNGHTHRNDVIPHPGPKGGFWEVNTAAHVDFPHQSRILEIVDNLDGTLSIFGTIVDAEAPLSVGSAASYAPPTTVAGLAGLARELGANDWQARPADLNGGRRGPVEARNVELLVAAPFDLGLGGARATPTSNAGSSGRPRSGPVIASTGARETSGTVAAALAVAAAGIAAARRRRTDGEERA